MYIVISSLISLYTICCSSPSLHLPVRPIFHCCTCAVNASIHICNSSLPPALPPLSLSSRFQPLTHTQTRSLTHTWPKPCLPSATPFPSAAVVPVAQYSWPNTLPPARVYVNFAISSHQQASHTQQPRLHCLRFLHHPDEKRKQNQMPLL